MSTVKKRRRKVGATPDGTPIYRDDGYQVRYVDPDGVERSKAFTKKGDADRFATEVEHRKLTGLYVDPVAGRVTFREYAEQWRRIAPHKPSTRARVETQLRLHLYPAIGDRPLAGIRASELRALVADRATVLAPATLEQLVAWLATIFRAAVNDRILVANPAEKINKSLPPAPPRPKVVPYSLAEVRSLHDGLPDQWRATVTLGVGAGLRIGETLGLTADRIDFLRRAVIIDRQLVELPGAPPTLATPKTKASGRTIPIAQPVLDELAAHIADHQVEPDGLLFRSANGQPIWHRSWYEAWRAAQATAGLDDAAKFHRLRHTYASALIGAGCSVKVVQARLGHASAQETLDTYAHMWPEDDDRTRDAIADFFTPPAGDEREHGAQ